MASVFAIASLTCISAADAAPSPADTLRLGEVQVTATPSALPRISSSGALNISRSAIDAAPRAFGEADPLRFLTLMPGVTAASDYSSGVSVDGMDYSQNLYRLNGIPVHFPYHFGGIMSVFSPAMYRRVTMYRTVKPASESGVLGGVVHLFTPENQSDTTLSAELRAGIISSSAFVALPIGKRLTVSASARASYINALYSSLLSSRRSLAGYNLADADLLALWRPAASHSLRATFHYNGDHVRYSDRAYSLTTALRWHNLLGGLSWIADAERFTAENTLYVSSFHNTLTMDMGAITLSAPTAIDEYGLRGTFTFTALPPRWGLTAGYEARLYSIVPQWVSLSGIGAASRRRPATLSAEISPSAEVTFQPSPRCRLTAGVLLSTYTAGSYTRFLPSPSLSAMWRIRPAAGDLSLTLALSHTHQSLHQVGFSEMGMSSNFKIAASRRVPPQQCDAASLAASFAPAALPGLSISADVYYKRIRRQPEYLGAVLDILSSSYLAEDYIFDTRGHNVGGSLSARLALPHFSAMATYGYCHTRRRMPGEPRAFSSSQELTHTLTAFVSWHPARRWIFSATFNLASGRPYTPVRSLYIIGETLMTEYGPRNSARLPMYHRLDLSASYTFTTGGRRRLSHEVNVSLLNAYGRENVEMRSFDINADTGDYRLRDISSLYRFLPSLSYTLKF